MGGSADKPASPPSGRSRRIPGGSQYLCLQEAQVLRNHLARRRAENLRGSLDDERGPWLFATDDGTPLDESRVRKAFKAALRQAGLPLRFTPHALRHTYATLMLAAGAPLTWASGQLGHSSPQVTLDWYSWALPSGDTRHASLLDATKACEAVAAAGRLVTTGDQPSPQVGAGARD